ncbi:MAG: tetratricopeptide repeat protein [Bacteroidales bacterium]|nr:tetratricopeptide repeat protein [Bacteroidales bacterium]
MKNLGVNHSNLISILLFFNLLLLMTANKTMAQSSQANEQGAQTVDDFIKLSKSNLSSDPQQALKYSGTALEIALTSKNDSLIAKAYKCRGTACYFLQQLKESVICWDSSLRYFEKTGKTKEIGNVSNNLGVAHSDLGNYQKSVDYYLKCLTMKRLEADSISVGHTYNNLGTIYYDLRAYNEAQPYFEKAKTIAQQFNDTESFIIATNNIGLIYTELHQFTEALRSFKESIKHAHKNEDLSGLAVATENIGNVFMFQEQSDSALKYFYEAQRIYTNLGQKNGSNFLGIGRSWHLKGEYDKALKSFHEALEIAQQSGDQKIKTDALRNIFETAKTSGNKPEAYNAAVWYIGLIDSVQTLFDSTAIINLQAKFEMKEKVHEIETLTLQKKIQEEQMAKQTVALKTQRAFLYLNLMALFIFIVLVILLVRFNRKYKRTSIDLRTQNQINLKTSIDLRISNKTLSEQEEILRTLIETSPDTILLKDGDGRWLKANQAMLSLFDLSNEDYKFKTDHDLGILKPFFTKAFEACAISDEVSWYNKQPTRSDEIVPMLGGGFKIYDTIKVALFSPDGSRQGLIIIGRDITQRKETELKLNAALKKAEESDRLKSAFLSNMSHEIRTPLNAIIGFSDLLKDENIQVPERHEYLRLIQENGDALLSLITDIIDLSQIEAGNTKINYGQFDLVALLNEIARQYIQLLKKSNKTDIEFQIDLPVNELIILSDIGKIRQVIINLLNNAIKFTDTGFIKVSLLVNKETEVDTNWFQVIVSDSGSGIPEGKKDQIFDRFAKFSDSNKRIYGGTGLGLSIVQKNMELLKGSINVESEPNAGTIVTATFPLIFAKRIDRNRTKKKFLNLEGKTILIVEDEQSCFELLKALIIPSGAILLHARDSIKAMHFCRKHREIALVVMDIRLPGMNGLELTKQIKELRPDLPVVIQTSFALPDEKEACFDSGCDGYLTKPIRSELLLPMLDEMVG